MDVDARYRGVHRLGDVDVVVAVEVRVDPTLQTYLGGTRLGRLDGPIGDVVERQKVRRAPQVE